MGDSERAVRDVFRKARQNAPCVVFMDEIDSLGTNRDLSGSGSNVESRVLSQMLNEMDGIGLLKYAPQFRLASCNIIGLQAGCGNRSD